MQDCWNPLRDLSAGDGGAKGPVLKFVCVGRKDRWFSIDLQCTWIDLPDFRAQALDGQRNFPSPEVQKKECELDARSCIVLTINVFRNMSSEFLPFVSDSGRGLRERHKFLHLFILKDSIKGTACNKGCLVSFIRWYLLCNESTLSFLWNQRLGVS